ncbi:MAG: endolytic transglycosylase MltG [Candidatus Adlerbacteria bacterium]
MKLRKAVVARTTWRMRKFLYGLGIATVLLSTIFFVLPSMLFWQQNGDTQPPFPVTVDPTKKTIKESPAVEAMFQKQHTPLVAAVASAGAFFERVALLIAATPLYQSVAAVGDAPQIVTIDPGVRKEQVVAKFAKVLGWNANTQKQFLQLPPVSNEILTEGSIAPGNYAVSSDTSIGALQLEVAERFSDSVLSRYTKGVQEIVPLNDGLTMASIIERETSDPDEMRIISGIIWNRTFVGMKLQMDSTLQYAKATGKGPWWPIVYPKDKYIDSPYNTYQNAGLPPAPIANPSVAAVLAALNPKKTSCLFYFHDDDGNFHCSDTYEKHVAMLKKYYGQGK